MNTIRVALLTIGVLLASTAAVVAAEPPIPCEWFPVDVKKPNGPWYQPYPSDECEAPYRNEVHPKMTLPPTDT